MRNFALNLTLLLATCLIGLVLGELSLRFFYPKYEAAAEAEYELDEFRIWKRTPNGRGTRKHPDTGLPHPLNYNNLGLRQARDFSGQEIKSATSIGFFGDSWTENKNVAVQYSFTEPLDYLLNLTGPPPPMFLTSGCMVMEQDSHFFTTGIFDTEKIWIMCFIYTVITI